MKPKQLQKIKKKNVCINFIKHIFTFALYKQIYIYKKKYFKQYVKLEIIIVLGDNSKEVSKKNEDCKMSVESAVNKTKKLFHKKQGVVLP